MIDKGSHFHIGSKMDFEEKAKKNFAETNAFVEASENPFNQVLDRVCQLLNEFPSKKLIPLWQ